MGFYKKILLLGKDGQVGWELQRALAPLGELTALNRSECDLRDLSKLATIIESLRPDLIVNAAGYTNVDAAETDQKAAFEINAGLPKFLATFSNVLEIPLVHFSSDYVFDGAKGSPYIETDKINPLSIYGKSKAAGEENIRSIANKYLIIRTSWVYGQHGENFPKKIVSLAKSKAHLDVVDDQTGVPTPASFLCNVLVEVLKASIQTNVKNIWGTYHVVPDGEVTWFDFSKLVIDCAQKESVPLSMGSKDVSPVSSDFFSSPAKRPSYSVLSNRKIKHLLKCDVDLWDCLACLEVASICKELKK